MASLDLQPLTTDRLDEAAELLAKRHARHRAAEPLLPSVDDFRPHIAREVEADGAAGLLATRGGRALGYLVGRIERDERLGDSRAVVGLAGCAAEEPEVIRDLYAGLAEGWVAQGVRRHQALVPASERDLVDAWFRLAFGVQFVTAVRETAPEQQPTTKIAIRAGTRSDLAVVARYDRELWLHQTRAPSFSGLDVPPQEEFEAEWEDTWDEPETYWTFVAEQEGRIVGEAVLYRRPTGDLRIPELNVDLAHAVTDPAVRGAGVGLALAVHVLSWAHAHGFRSMTTDWRSVNLLSSRFWPRRGFRPTFLRLYRHIP